MEKLLNVLDKHGIIFVDSKTSSSDVIKNLYQIRNQVYIQRDIFLDNQSNSESILEQLEKALNLANKSGFAIVIEHQAKYTECIKTIFK
ncbi:hypothetical protein LS73_004895 [Helicobacter muridarum]|uniref:Divergent polysaccharide deacetylase n=1 Tax=Helicobacter muridarum TaxID=216 RepID=A0A377PSK1_9HELI|nr:hypothetical protein LS73_004895 [Helicobacter muridarum]STQ85826.1 Divergent polysaccharide deacetylase [Helicobacter muridarum]